MIDSICRPARKNVKGFECIVFPLRASQSSLPGSLGGSPCYERVPTSWRQRPIRRRRRRRRRPGVRGVRAALAEKRAAFSRSLLPSLFTAIDSNVHSLSRAPRILGSLRSPYSKTRSQLQSANISEAKPPRACIVCLKSDLTLIPMTFMQALRRSIKGDKEKQHTSIGNKSAVAIIPPKKVRQSTPNAGAILRQHAWRPMSSLGRAAAMTENGDMLDARLPAACRAHFAGWGPGTNKNWSLGRSYEPCTTTRRSHRRS